MRKKDEGFVGSLLLLLGVLILLFNYKKISIVFLFSAVFTYFLLLFLIEKNVIFLGIGSVGLVVTLLFSLNKYSAVDIRFFPLFLLGALVFLVVYKKTYMRIFVFFSLSSLFVGVYFFFLALGLFKGLSWLVLSIALAFLIYHFLEGKRSGIVWPINMFFLFTAIGITLIVKDYIIKLNINYIYLLKLWPIFLIIFGIILLGRYLFR